MAIHDDKVKTIGNILFVVSLFGVLICFYIESRTYSELPHQQTATNTILIDLGRAKRMYVTQAQYDRYRELEAVKDILIVAGIVSVFAGRLGDRTNEPTNAR